MEPVSNVNPMLDALRKQLAENIERLRRSGRLGAGNGAAAATRGQAVREPLEARLRRRVGAIDRRSPEGRAVAMRAFVETVLLAEFGEELLTDPGFGEMLSEMSAMLAGDAELDARLDRVLDEI
jgi:hypothetical protein